ncbi:MAG: apolipoprotein N-acyltransferase [Clostridia bacterium]|nr:apolipoprotein N-acyltransferase [Clostridia bacterium]
MKEDIRKYSLPYLLIGALLTGLTLVFPQVGFLEWMTMIPIFIGAYRVCGSEKYSPKRAYWYGFLTVFVFYFVNYHWFLYLHPLDSVGIDRFSSVVIVTAGWVGLPILQALPGGLIFLLFKLLHRTELLRRLPWLRPISFSVLWVVFEWSSTLHWTGVPWGRLCLGQANYLPMLQTASLFGSYFVSFLILLVNGFLAYAILYRAHVRRAIICTAVAAALMLSNLLLGIVLMDAKTESDTTVRIAALQGNINSHEIWTSKTLEETKQIYAKLTGQAVADGAELIVWPETAFPYTLNDNTYICNYLSSLAREYDVTMLVGALYRDEDSNKYNALYLIEPDGTFSSEIYLKRHLVPFGEYVPMRELILAVIPPLAEFSDVMDNNLVAGADSALQTTEWGSIGGLLCFDSIYEELALDSVRDGAELLVLSSNDSWFYDSAAIYQHEAQAMLRAIETGRYLVRSGNTGISTVITDKGVHLAWVDALTEGYAVADVELKTNTTLYSHIGNLFVYICIASYFACLTIGIVWSKRKTV